MRVESRWGPVSFIDKDMYVGRSLYYYGEYNPDETEFVCGLYTEGRVLDIGANYGVIGMALETLGATVEYFEPQPWVFEHLVKNVRGVCHNIAVGSYNGSVQFPKPVASGYVNYGGIGIGSHALNHITVDMKTIDSFDYTDVSLMKIDVEGYEENVLRGAEKTITRCRPILYVEDDRFDKSASLWGYIMGLGYRIEKHSPPLYREQNYKGLKRNIWDKNYVSSNIVCYPLAEKE